MVKPIPKLMTVTEYLESEIGSAVRREYMGGRAYALAGSSLRHSRIAGNIHAHFWQLAQRVHQEAVKLRAGTDEDPEGAFYHPDAMMVCDKTPPPRVLRDRALHTGRGAVAVHGEHGLAREVPRVHLPTQPAHLFGGGSGYPVRAAQVRRVLAAPRPYRRWSDSVRQPDYLRADLWEGVQVGRSFRASEAEG